MTTADNIGASIREALGASRYDTFTCEHCGNERSRYWRGTSFVSMELAPPGPLPRYCTNRCRQAAYRARAKDRLARRSGPLPELDVEL